MTSTIQQGSLLDVLKKKMRQTKEEMERYKDECEEYNKRLQAESMRREEVRFLLIFIVKTAKITVLYQFRVKTLVSLA